MREIPRDELLRELGRELWNQRWSAVTYLGSILVVLVLMMMGVGR